MAPLIFLSSGVRGQIVWIAGVLLGYWAALILVPVPEFGAGDLAPRFKKAAALLRSAAGLWDAAHDGRSSPIAALDALPGGCALADGDARPAEATRGVCSGCAIA